MRVRLRLDFYADFEVEGGSDAEAQALQARLNTQCSIWAERLEAQLSDHLKQNFPGLAFSFLDDTED